LVWFSTAPPDIGWLFGNLTVEGVLLTPSLRVGTNVPAWTWATIGLIVTALVSALYPALRAARVPPADTLSGRVAVLLRVLVRLALRNLRRHLRRTVLTPRR